MIRNLSGFLILLLLSSSISRAAPVVPDSVLLRREAQKDVLGARLRVRELMATPLDFVAWRWIRDRVEFHPEWGDDLAWFYLDRVAGTASWAEPSPLQLELQKADSAMLARRFEEAAGIYRSVLANARAGEMGRTSLLHVRLDLARALYGAKKFDEARAEARRISPNFSRYRQVLFLQMWSAFRAGRVELALGDIAAQRSHFFGEYLEPETYLLLTYLLKRLCRDSEAAAVISRGEQFMGELRSGKFGMRAWAGMDVGTRSYLAIAEAPDPSGLGARELELRRREKSSIKSRLEAGFLLKKKQWLEELPRVLSYSRLAAAPGMSSALKPIEKISSRDRLLSQGLEIWPANDGEQWLDELGSQRYIGDSQCAAQH